MKIVQVHSVSKVGGGADVAVDATIRLLRKNGVTVQTVTLNMNEMGTGFLNHLGIFALNSFPTRKGLRQAKEILSYDPDIVHVHDVFPMFSAWIIEECRRANIPVVMTCHSYGPICPTYQHLRGGEICYLCKGGREYYCLLKNCRKDYFQSLGYAVRSIIIRICGFFKEKITFFIAPTPFVKAWYISAGFPADRIVVVPYLVDGSNLPVIDPEKRKYAGFAGRFSHEKGISTLLDACRITGLPFKFAGDHNSMPELVSKSPRNVTSWGTRSN